MLRSKQFSQQAAIPTLKNKHLIKCILFQLFVLQSSYFLFEINQWNIVFDVLILRVNLSNSILTKLKNVKFIEWPEK